MKVSRVCGLAVVMVALSGLRLNAWHICLDVVCKETGQAIPGATVEMKSTDCSFDQTAVADQAGHVCFSVCESPACYSASLGSTVLIGLCLDSDTPLTDVLEVPCSTPQGCPECVNPDLGLGATAGCTVLELGTAKVSITGPAGGILGDICIAPGGSLAMSGDEFVTGTVNLGAGAKFSNSSHGTVKVVPNVDLSGEISDAYARAASAAALPCTQAFAKLDGSGVTTITGTAGLNVICVGDIVLSGKQITVTGPAGAEFIFNVKGKLVLTGGGAGPQIRVAGAVEPKDVLFNIMGTGPDVAFSGGGGGVNCCAAIVDGTLLAPYRKINLSPGLVNGQVISGLDINIVSGSSVRCPPCP